MTTPEGGTDVAPASAGRCLLLALAVLLLAACGSDARENATTPLDTVSASTAALGPATAQFTFVGDTAQAAGSLMAPVIICAVPDLAGMTIGVFGQTSAPGVNAYVTLRAGSINVRLGSGAGTTSTSRTFNGTGVTGFDAARGVHISSPLTEATQAGSATGTLPKLVSISGSVDCGNQLPGSGTITVTGDTEEGPLGDALSPLHVTCLVPSSGERVVIVGLTHIGSTEVAIEIGGGAGAPAMFVVDSPSTAASHSFNSSTAGSVTFSGSHVILNGTVTESVTGTATAHTLTVSGDATCGLTY